MPETVYLVSGANRGIGMYFPSLPVYAYIRTAPTLCLISTGLGIVTELAGHDNTIVFAGARNPDAAKDLHALVEKHPGKVHIVKLISADRAGNDVAVEEIKATAGRLDVVIANAGD